MAGTIFVILATAYSAYYGYVQLEKKDFFKTALAIIAVLTGILILWVRMLVHVVRL